MMNYTAINEIASLQQACSIQERLNSEMAVASTKYRAQKANNEDNFRIEYAEFFGTKHEDKARQEWAKQHRKEVLDEYRLYQDKVDAEKYAAELYDLVERLAEKEYHI